MTTMTFPEDLLRTTELSQQELAVELAIALYQREKLTLGQAARLAGMDGFDFQQLLGSREIPLTLNVDDLEQDLATMRRLGKL